MAQYCNTMADILAIKACYTEAIAYYQESLQITEKHLGADHPEVVSTVNTL